MLIRRRHFLMAAAAASLLPPRVWAAAERQLGAGTLISLSDGHLVLPESYVVGDVPDEAELRDILAAARGQGPVNEPPCNVSLWRSGDATVLFDSGSGPAFMETTGELPNALAAVGIDPSEITHVVFTHGHPDHFWGVLDDFDEPVFPNARHLMGAEEHAYWSNPGTKDTIAATRQNFAAGALRRLEVLGDALELFSDGDEVAPAVRAVATFGHSPGHMSFDLGDMMVVGDAIQNAHIAVARPDWPSPADEQPEIAIKTRVALLQRLAEAATPILGFHLPNGGVGTIARDGEGYAFIPAG